MLRTINYLRHFLLPKPNLKISLEKFKPEKLIFTATYLRVWAGDSKN